MLLTSILLSSIICHGFLDLWIIVQNTNFIIYYIFGFGIFDAFLKINPSISIVFFIILSMYHFGKDFQIITGKTDNSVIVNGITTISSTLFCNNGTVVWFQFLNFLGVEPKDIFAIYRLMEFCLLMSLLTILILEDWKLKIYNIIRLFIISHMSVETTILYHMLIIHVPLAVYQFKKVFGMGPVYFWIITSLFTGTLIDKFGLFVNENDIQLSISITMSHMFTISFWQMF